MGYVTRVPGTKILAASHNSEYRDQVISQFATISARDAAITSPVNGMVCYITAEQRLYMYSGGAWQRTGVSAIGGRSHIAVRRVAAIALVANTDVAVTWDTEDVDTDALIPTPSTTVTMTAAAAGMWMVNTTGFWSTGTGSTWIVIGGTNAAFGVGLATNVSGGNNGSCSWVGFIGAGTTVAIGARCSAVANYTGRLDMIRLGP